MDCSLKIQKGKKNVSKSVSMSERERVGGATAGGTHARTEQEGEEGKAKAGRRERKGTK